MTMTKQQEDKNRADIHRLVDLVLDINGFEDRQKEITGDKPTVFFNLFGHVSNIEVKVHEKGWTEGRASDLGSNLYFDKPMQIDELIKRLERLVPK